MKTLKLVVNSIIIFILSIGASNAFELNPLQNKYGQDEIDEDEVIQRITSPVHEEITNISRNCSAYINNKDFKNCNPEDRFITEKGNKWDPLIRGVWWNDDPNQLLYGARQAKWFAWMRDGKKIAKTGKNYLGKKSKITKNYYMQYRSHFGDLQFLHSMASSNGEDVLVTKNNILAWTEFAYAVAIEKIKPSTTLNDVDTSEFQKYFKHRPGWSVHYLFSPRYTLGEKSVPDVALGSILHMIQDSFSKAHVKRKYDSTDQCPNGRIVSFHSYVDQNGDKHNTEDTHSAWVNNNYPEKQNPVYASAKILAYAQKKADWEAVVSKYVSDDLFCTDEDTMPSSDGGY